MKRAVSAVLTFGLLAAGFMGCSSTQGPKTPTTKAESQLEKSMRLLLADNEKLVVGSDGQATITSIESVLQPRVISEIGEITKADLSEPGRPYYFKIRAIYKGYDADAQKALLQDLGEKQANTMDSALEAVFGLDTDVYSMSVVDAVVSTLPPEANSIAAFYVFAVHFTENEGQPIDQTEMFIRFVRDIEKPVFDPAKFIVANGLHYITTADAHVTTQRDVMEAYFLGGASGRTTANVFDPIGYPLVDLMDARYAMDKKDYRNDMTFPTLRVKYVSEVIFKGQSNTTITVSTDDDFLTERMNFTGRTSTVKAGDRIRVYFTIAKDPLEEWRIQAIERL